MTKLEEGSVDVHSYVESIKSICARPKRVKLPQDFDFPMTLDSLFNLYTLF